MDSCLGNWTRREVVTMRRRRMAVAGIGLILAVMLLPIVPVHQVIVVPQCQDRLCEVVAVHSIQVGWCTPKRCQDWSCQGNGLAPIFFAVLGWDFMVIDIQAPLRCG